jgi:putative ABC transport system substrate-binding protein
MNRRAFIVGASMVLSAPLDAAAQRSGKVWRIGYLSPADNPRGTLIEALREVGYVEGQTVRFEVRTAKNDLTRLPELARDLVRAQVDLIVAVSPPAIIAAKQVTTTIPVVMRFWGGEGLVESGVVASFVRPGGNITGVYMFAAELDAKRLELLLEALPRARTIGVLNPGRAWSLAHLRQFAEKRRIQLHLSDVPGPKTYEPTFSALSKAGADGVLVPSFPRFYEDHLRIVEAAAARRLPTIYEWGDIARAGGLIAYGPLLTELDRRVAAYIDKILKGAKPGDLAIEQATRFELVINLRTANALGLSVPQGLLLRADQVIE